MSEVHAGQAVVTEPGEWVRYSTPAPGGGEYVAVCLPAFSPDTVHHLRIEVTDWFAGVALLLSRRGEPGARAHPGTAWLIPVWTAVVASW